MKFNHLISLTLLIFLTFSCNRGKMDAQNQITQNQNSKISNEKNYINNNTRINNSNKIYYYLPKKINNVDVDSVINISIKDDTVICILQDIGETTIFDFLNVGNIGISKKIYNFSLLSNRFVYTSRNKIPIIFYTDFFYSENERLGYTGTLITFEHNKYKDKWEMRL